MPLRIANFSNGTLPLQVRPQTKEPEPEPEPEANAEAHANGCAHAEEQTEGEARLREGSPAHPPDGSHSPSPDRPHGLSHASPLAPQIANAAAGCITRCMRRNVASRAYQRMFTKGFDFRCGLSEKEGALANGMTLLSAWSSANLREVSERVGPLTTPEALWFDKVLKTEWRFKHQTIVRPVREGALTLYSNAKLSAMDVAMRSGTLDTDRFFLANDDFVFLTLECGPPEDGVFNAKHHAYDFGPYAYIVNETNPCVAHGYLTLTDHLETRVDVQEFEHAAFARRFARAGAAASRRINGGAHGKPPLFELKDMKRGLALHMIEFLRSCTDVAFRVFVMRCEPGSEEMDRAIHLIFQPEFHVPRLLSTYDYTQQTLRAMSLGEAVDAVDTDRMLALIRAPEDAIEAMAFALGNRVSASVVFLLKHCRYDSTDRKEIATHFLEKSVATLCATLEGLPRGDSIVTLLRNAGWLDA